MSITDVPNEILLVLAATYAKTLNGDIRERKMVLTELLEGLGDIRVGRGDGSRI